MFNQKSLIVFFVDRNRFTLFGGNLTGIISLDVPEVLVHDLEVVGKDGLYTLIKQWMKQYNIIGSQLVIVFSEVTCFEKVFSTREQTQIESDVLKFIDTVPLETVWSKVYDTDKGKRAVAISRSLFETVHQGFALQGLPTKAVIPAFALGPLSNKRQLDAELYQYVIKNLDSLMKMSLLDSQEISSSQSSDLRSAVPAKQKASNLPFLLGIFGVLIVVLIVLVIFVIRPT